MNCLSGTKVIVGSRLFAVKGKSKPAEDLSLVERAKGGDVSAFRELVERYQQKVQAVAMSVSCSFEEAEDIAQETFLKAFRSLSSFRNECSFYTWIYRIAYNLSIDHMRKRYKQLETSLECSKVLDKISNATQSVAVNGQRPDKNFETAELGSQIQEAIENLSAEHRAVILLREVEGLSYAEISEVVGCSKGTVMSRLHHARKRLQEVLAGQAETPHVEDAGEVKSKLVMR
ncbi:MAG: sigma-70 family RNA polymerase sigma factor [Deltaproteobacteria bacterium]|nr:sigma-70 family RNA polymerase sigma factor [Deltaproteobacteria bacterium]